MELSEIILMVKHASEQHLVSVSDDMILDCSTRIFNSQNFEKKENKNYTNKPTEKQLFVLKKLKIPNIDKVTFQEATKIIGEHKKKQED